jgi:gas vesicle structural protein
MAVVNTSGGPSGGTLGDVLEMILDRGVVIDAFVRVSLVGIEILTIDARVVIASVDTYLRFAEAVNRMHLDTPKRGVPDLIEGRKTAGAIEAATERLGALLGAGPEPEKAKR